MALQQQMLQSMTEILAAVRANQEAIQKILAERPDPAATTGPTTIGGSPPPQPPAAAQPHASATDEAKPTSDGSHAPPRADHYDFMRSEKSVAIYLSKNRLEPYDRDITYQLDELKDLFLTPAMDEPANWMSLDAYTRQSNKLEEAMEEFVDRWRRDHDNWRTAGGDQEKFCYRGVTELEGRSAREAREQERHRLEHHRAFGLSYPVLEEYKQDMTIDHPSADITTGRYCLHDGDGTLRRRLKDTKVEVPKDDARFNDLNFVEHMPQQISNDPTQFPYLGRFAAGRALDKYGYYGRDLALAKILVKFTEQAHLRRAELKCHKQLHSLDLVRCDALSYNVIRYILHAFPESHADKIQAIRAQYEGAQYHLDYYFSDFIAFLVECNAELKKLGDNISYSDKEVFKKVQTVMSAAFVSDATGDALHKAYCKVAALLVEERSALTDRERAILDDLAAFQHHISRNESRIVAHGLPGRLPKDANLSVVLPKVPTPAVQHGYRLDDDDGSGGDLHQLSDDDSRSQSAPSEGASDDDLHVYGDFRARRERERAAGTFKTMRERGRPPIGSSLVVGRQPGRSPSADRKPPPRFSRKSTSSGSGYHTPSAHNKPTGVHPKASGGGRDRPERGSKPRRDHRHHSRPSGEQSKGTTAVRKPDAPDFRAEAKRKARVIRAIAEKGKANPSGAVDALSRIQQVTEEIEELRKQGVIELVDNPDDDSGYDTATPADEEERNNATQDIIANRLSELGIEPAAARDAAALALHDMMAEGCFPIVTGVDLMQLDSDSPNRAFVDTCGSKCFIRNSGLCKPGSVFELTRPIKVKMGKGFSMATHTGVLEYTFRRDDSSVWIIPLPVLVCPDFDSDLIILSGPMLNAVNIGLGPTTNYLVSLDMLKSKSVPVEPDSNDVVIKIDKTSNSMPFINLVESDGMEAYDFVTHAPYDYLAALRRLREAFPTMASKIPENAHVSLRQDVEDERRVLEDMVHSLNVTIVKSMMPQNPSAPMVPGRNDRNYSSSRLASTHVPTCESPLETLQTNHDTTPDTGSGHDVFHDAHAERAEAERTAALPQRTRQPHVPQQTQGSQASVLNRMDPGGQKRYSKSGIVHKGVRTPSLGDIAAPVVENDLAPDAQRRSRTDAAGPLQERHAQHTKPSRPTRDDHRNVSFDKYVYVSEFEKVQGRAKRSDRLRDIKRSAPVKRSAAFMGIVAQNIANTPPPPCYTKFRSSTAKSKNRSTSSPHKSCKQRALRSSGASSTGVVEKQETGERALPDDSARGLAASARQLSQLFGFTKIFTVFLVCYGLATASTFSANSRAAANMRLPIRVIGGVERNEHQRRDFETHNPAAAGNSHADMRAFVEKCERDDDLRKRAFADIWEVTPPCYDNTTLKSYNQSGDHPDRDLFTLQVRAVELCQPTVVLSEMTPPDDDCHLVHKEVAQRFRDVGYDVQITERLSADNTGDRTARQRWILVARKAPTGPLDLVAFAQSKRTAVRDVLDDPSDVDPELWVDCEFEPSPSSTRGGEHPHSITDVGPLTSHARLIGYCKGYPHDKGWRIYDIDYPIPTITRFGNILIRQDGRIRFLSISEMARASSFTDQQVKHLAGLESKGFGAVSLKIIANAVPRKLLHTMYRAAVFELQRGVNINDKNDTGVTMAMAVTPFVCKDMTAGPFDPEFNDDLRSAMDDFYSLHAPEIEDSFYVPVSDDFYDVRIDDDGQIRDPNEAPTEPTEIPQHDLAPTLRPDGHRATTSRSSPSLADYPRYTEGTAEFANATARAARYHAITHHSARKMEWNIKHGYSLGCKPGDSQYLQPCTACIRTGLDRFQVPQVSRDVSDRHTYNPGEMWFIDGSDSKFYSNWGHKRYCINAVCACSFYRVCFYTTTNNASEFCEFLDYLVRFTKLRTGNDVKKVYSDYFSTYMDTNKVVLCRTREGRKIELEVTPPYAKARNTYAENSIYANRKGTRARLFNLIGASIKGVPIKNTGPYWLFAWEHTVQTHNFSAYEPLMELYGEPTSPLQAFTGDRTVRHPVLRPFGEPCHMIQQLEKRPNKLADTSTPAFYLFNGSYNPITNVLADSPQSHVILLANDTLRISGRVAFPYEHRMFRRDPTYIPNPVDENESKHPDFSDLPDTQSQPATQPAPPTITHSPFSNRARTAAATTVPTTTTTAPPGPDASVVDPLSTVPESAPRLDPLSPRADFPQRAAAARAQSAIRRQAGLQQDDAQEGEPRTTTPHGTPSTPVSAKPTFMSRIASRLPVSPRRLHPEIPSSPASTLSSPHPPPPSAPAVAPRVSTPAFQRPAGAPMAPTSGDVSPPLSIPPFNVLKDLDEPIVWNRDRAVKRGASAERLAKYISATTTKQYVAQHPGPLSKARADFEDEFKRGFFEFTRPEYRGLKLLATNVCDVTSPGGDDTSFWAEFYNANAGRLRRDPLAEQRLQSELDKLHGYILGLTEDEYRGIRTGVGYEKAYDTTALAYLDTHDAVYDQLMFMLNHNAHDYQEIWLQIVDPQGDDVPLVDSKDVRLDQFRLQDLKNVDKDQIKPMVEAIAKEIEGLCQNGVFQFVRYIPDGKKALDSRIVLKVKYRADGSYDRHKGRLVVKGFQAIPGVDFFSTFSPMGTLTTVRMILSIATAMGLDVVHVDIPQAFIQSKIDVPIYVQLPSGITVDARYQDGKYNNRVVRLLRALYGLKQSPQLWNKELNRVLTDELQFSRSINDSCLYYHESEKGFVLLVAEVDDLVITGTDQGKIDALKADFLKRYKITAWERISSFLGINIAYDRQLGVMELDVKAKVDELFKRYPILLDCPTRSTPLSASLTSPANADAYKPNKVDFFIKEHYASIVGALIYMSITVRADLALAVGKCSRGMHDPSDVHVSMLRHVVGYIKVHRAVKLTYKREKQRIQQLYKEIADVDSALQTIHGYDFGKLKDPLVGFTDSDFASGQEKDMKSISGMAYFIFGNLVYWKSKLQPLTAKSTHAAELIALSFATDEAVWMRRLLIELGFVVPHIARIVPAQQQSDGDYAKLQEMGAALSPPILCDNKGTVFTANNPSVDLNTKALSTRWYALRDLVKDGILRVFHIGTNQNVADFFTKSLTGEKFTQFRDILMGYPVKKDSLLFSFSRHFLETPRIIPNPACLHLSSLSPVA